MRGRLLLFLALALGLLTSPTWAGTTSTLAPTCLSPTSLSPTALSPTTLVTLGCTGYACTQANTFIARTSGENNIVLANLICGLVTDGLITGDLTSSGTKCGSLLERLYIHAMANSVDGLLDVCGNVSAVTHGSPTFTANAGFAGVDSSGTVYIDTGFVSNTGVNYTQNSAHLAAWSFTNALASASGGVIIGAYNGVSNSDITPRYSDGNLYLDLNDNGGNANAASSDSTGYWLVNRTDSLNITAYRNATSVAANSASTSTVPSALSIYILNRNDNPPTFGGGYQIALSHFGAQLTGAQITNLKTRFCTYLTAVHGSC